jgi:hypothetical protein
MPYSCAIATLCTTSSRTDTTVRPSPCISSLRAKLALTSSSITKSQLSQLCVPKMTAIRGTESPVLFPLDVDNIGHQLLRPLSQAPTSAAMAPTRVRTPSLKHASVSDFVIQTGGSGSGEIDTESSLLLAERWA